MNFLRRWLEHCRNPRTVVADTPRANVFAWPEETSTTSFRIQSEEIGEWDSDENLAPYEETTPITPSGSVWGNSGTFAVGTSTGYIANDSWGTIVNTNPYASINTGDTIQQHTIVSQFSIDPNSSPVAILRSDDIFEVYLRPEIDIHIADNVADDIEIDLPEGWTTISSPGKVILTKLYDEDENAS